MAYIVPKSVLLSLLVVALLSDGAVASGPPAVAAAVFPKNSVMVDDNNNYDDFQRFARQTQKEMLPLSVLQNVERHRDLQWTIDFTPNSDPAMVCADYQKALNNTFECQCESEPDLSVAVECLEVESTCNADSSLCFLQTIKLGLTPQTNKVVRLETCSNYITNLTRFEGSSTQLANYSDLVPCVTVVPIAENDFSQLSSCAVSINGETCQSCEICTDNAPALGMTIDCCNLNPEDDISQPLKMTCGGVGGGGGTYFF